MNEQELREKTKKSIARLVAHRRGAEVADDKDHITASNILFVCSRLIDEIGNQRELEGRIDERVLVRGEQSKPILNTEERIKELQSQQAKEGES